MKQRTRLTAGITVLILGFLTAAGMQSTRAGIFDLLRGPRQETKIGYQRVAFIGSANVRTVGGSVERLVGIDLWKPLEAGIELKPGDLLRTASNGTALLRMNESQSFVKLTPNSILRLVERREEWDSGCLSGFEQAKGFVVRGCRGKAYRRHGTDWMEIQVNTVLSSGTEVRTRQGAILDLFHNETQRPFRINGAAQLKLDHDALAKRRPAERNLVVAREF